MVCLVINTKEGFHTERYCSDICSFYDLEGLVIEVLGQLICSNPAHKLCFCGFTWSSIDEY
jgi:hypothetical protein